MPASALSVAGNLTASQGTATTVAFTARGAFTVGGNVALGAGTTFNGSTFSHSVGGNWVNNGTFTGGTSTVTLNGVNTVMSGAGANGFYNLVIARSGISADAATSLNVAGDFSTSGAGTFTHTAGGAGTVTMSGASKSISGTGISFNKLTLSGSISTAASFTIADNLAVDGTLTASAGTITLSGTTKTISGSGTIAFSALSVTGSITTAKSFSVAGNLGVIGSPASLTATAGMVTLVGSTLFSGTANLFNTTLNGTLLQMGVASVLCLAGTTTLSAGTFDVTTQRPNTIVYNSASSQTVYPITYDNLQIATGGTKSAGGDITVRGDFIIDPFAVFGGGNSTIYVRHHWLNSGTFTAGTGTVEFWGPNDSTITGATTFNQLRVNKDSSSLLVSLSANQTAATLDMFLGTLDTGSNTLTITSDRTGAGHVLGTITRQHSFSAATAYAFESPFTTVTFASLPTTLTSVTMTATPGSVSDFPSGAAINRQYTVSLVSTGAYSATLRAYYEDTELNGNTEASMVLWQKGVSWASVGKSANDTTDNWVEKSAIIDLAGRWTLSSGSGVARWNGSVSTAWETAANWSVAFGSPSLPPVAADIVELGTAAGATYQPTITSAAAVRSIAFGSAQAMILTLAPGGGLGADGIQTIGNVGGEWSGNVDHTINVNAQTMTVGGDLTLSDGTLHHTINLNISTGSVTVANNLVQSADASIIFSGAGTLNIGGSFLYTSGTFTAGSGTVNYTGSVAQTIGGVTYHHLAFNKTGGSIATLPPAPPAATVGGDLTLAGSGCRVRLDADLVVTGNVTIGTGTILDLGGMALDLGGNWVCSGTLNISSGGEVALIGGLSQSIGACAFHDLDIEKTTGSTATLVGNISVVQDVDVNTGTLDLATYTVNQSSAGAIVKLAANTTLRTAGSFPSGFTSVTLDPASTVEYYGTGVQTVAAETYGNLTLTGGSSNAKTLAGPCTAGGDLLINSSATLAASSYSLTLQGNWTNSGAFTAGTGTVILSGTSKAVTGATTFYNLTVPGSYAAGSYVVTIQGNTTILGSYTMDSGATTTLDGDLNNTGTFHNNGTLTFSGTRVQDFVLNAGFNSEHGTVNFNGTVSPYLHSTTSPHHNIVNINNTGGVTTGIGWVVDGAFTVGSGATFNGSIFTHTFYGTVTNGGTMSSSGALDFSPSSDTTVTLGNAFSSTGTVAFSGINHITLSGGGALSLASVHVGNTHAAGITPGSNWTLSGDLEIDAGATFHAGALTHTIAGTISNAGTLDGGTSTVVFNGASALRGAGSTRFYNVQVNSLSSLINTVPMELTHNFTNNGIFDPAGSDLIFSGDSASAIAGSTTPTTLDSLIVAKSPGIAVTLGVHLSSLSALAVTSGTLDTGAYTLTQNGAGGTLSVGASGTLKLGGTTTFPTFGSLTLDPGSTVEYGGGAQTVAALSYANLVLSGSDNKTLSTITTINGNVNITGSAKFDLTYSSGSYSPAGSLAYAGVLQAQNTTYGSTSSSATSKTDTYFQGTGKLAVGSIILDHFAVTTPATQTAGTPFTVTITAQDANNVTVPGFTGTVDLTETGDGTTGTVTPPTSGTFTGGVLSGQSITLTKAGAAVTLTVADHAGTGKTGVSDPFLVNPGALHHYEVTLPAPTFYAGVAFATTVTAHDVNNNTVTTDSSTVVTMTSSLAAKFDNGSTFVDTTDKTLASGTFTISTRDDVAEAGQTITATSTGPITGTSAAFATVVVDGAYRSKTSGNWGDAGTWEKYRSSGSAWEAATSAPSSADAVISIQSPHVVTVAANVIVDQVYVMSGAKLIVSSGITLTIWNATSPGIAVNGTLDNYGIITTTGPLLFDSPGGTYRHLFSTDAGVIPTATWNAGSLCEIAGYSSNTTAPSGLNQSFSNLTWNCPSQTGTIALGGSPTAIGANFTVTSTGGGALTLGASLAVTGATTVSSGATLNCSTYTVTGAAFTLAAGGTLGSGSPDGITASDISGNIQTTSRSFSETANYTYNGGVAQVTGSGLPVTVNNLSIANSSGVTLTTATAVSGTLALGSSGKLKIGSSSQSSTAYALTIGGVSQPAGTWGSTAATATYKDNTRFDSAGDGIVRIDSGAGAYRLTGTGQPQVGVGYTVNVALADAAGATVASFTGTRSMTFNTTPTLSPGADGSAAAINGVAQNVAANVTFTAGVGSVTLVAHLAESSKLITVTDGALTSAETGGTTLTVSPTAGADSAYRITAATTTPVAGASDQLTLTLVDLYQNVSSFSGDKTLTFSDLANAPLGAIPTITDKTGAAVDRGTATTITFTAGVSTAGGLLVAKKAETATLHVMDVGALSTATPGGAGVSLTVSTAAASQLAFATSPGGGTGGTAWAQQPVVTAEDTYGNAVAATVTLAIATNAGPGGVLSGTLTKATVAGVANFSANALKIDKIGTGYTLTATDDSLNSTTSAPFNITLGAAAKLAFTTQPSASTPQGTAFATQPVVTVQDAGGNTVIGDTSTVTVAIGTNPGGGTLGGTPTKAAVAGVADFTLNGLSISVGGGGYTLTATDGSLTAATSDAFSISKPLTLASLNAADTGFGTAGAVLLNAGGGAVADWARRVAVQADGKLVTAGGAGAAGARTFCVARFNTNGTPDESFGSGGKVLTQAGTADSEAFAVAIQADGMVVAAGRAKNAAGNDDWALVRYTTAGALDTSFHADGIVTTDLSGSTDVAYALVLQWWDDHIVVVGVRNNIGDYAAKKYDMAATRYTETGAVDTTYGTAGTTLVAMNATDTVDDVALGAAIQKDGKVVLAGHTTVSTRQVLAVVRLRTTGALDTTFDTDGKVTLAAGSGAAGATAVVVQPDGRIVVSGSADNGATGWDQLAARWTAAGVADGGFGSGGLALVISAGAQDDLAFDLALRPDGRIVLAGSTAASSGSIKAMLLTGLLSNGDPDAGFGQVLPTVGSGDGDAEAYGAALAPGGKLVAAGKAYSGTGFDTALVQLQGVSWEVRCTHDAGVGEIWTPVSDTYVESRLPGLTCVAVRLAEAVAPGSVSTASLTITDNDSATHTVTGTTVAADGRTLVFTFAALPDVHRYAFALAQTLTNVAGAPLTGVQSLTLRALAGDADGNGAVAVDVSIADLIAIRACASLVVIPALARYDINADGRINVSDLVAARAMLGHTLP
jgi:uncharacterized delta-60 repeat protein